MDLMNRLLRKEITAGKAAEIFQENGINAKERNIYNIIRTIRDKDPEIQNAKSTQKLNKRPQQHKQETDLIASNLKNELLAIETLDYSKVKEVDPIKILDKNMIKLELMMTRYSGPLYLKEQGAIIELEMKIAREIYKMRPTSTEFDMNTLLRRNDWGTEFILVRYPELKDEFLSWMSEKQALEE